MYENVAQHYFDWLYDKAVGSEYPSYKKALYFLFNKQFYCDLPMDTNRAEDGITLRYLFGVINDYPDYIIACEIDTKPCSVLEMMVALSIRMERIVDDPDEGDRTSKWFMCMITNLGLSDCTDDNYDEQLVDRKTTYLMDRQFKSNGEGGLFTLKHPRSDLRRIEFWYHAMWFLTEHLFDEL